MMERISNATPDITQENIDKIAELFPDVITEVLDEEGKPKQAIDFDALRGNLQDEIVEGTRERYQFTWPSKAEAKLEARKPCTKTMRPCPAESVNWDASENLYIEGDNLEALKIMRETYLEPEQLDQGTIYDYIDNLKDDRTPEDLLFQVLPAFRIPYSAKIESFEADGKTVYNVNDGQLLACFDAEVGTSTIEEIAKRKPVYAVLRDASLKDDATSANFEELFKTYSPDTVRRVI